MKTLTIIAALILLSSCKTENKEKSRFIASNSSNILSNNEEEVQTKKKSHNKIKTADIKLGKQIMVSSAQFSTSQEIYIDGCLFDAVIRESNDTIYLATNDLKFITPEKINVGTKFSKIPKDVRQNIQKENGWGYYIELESKWCIGFCEGTSCTDKEIKSESEVKWIFKRK